MRASATMAILVALAGCSSGGGPAPGSIPVTFTVGGVDKVIHAEIADTEDERQRGLMERSSMPDDAGMLFVWDTSAPRIFYMRDTLIPLDLIGIADGRIVSIQQMEPCRADPCPTTTTALAGAALEINKGVAGHLGLRVGTRVAFDLGADSPSASPTSSRT
jgi:uncharacterized membrane protein (UPF0127 family)